MVICCLMGIFSLTGDPGAGKTAFTRGIARGLDEVLSVTSPTFTIINEYYGSVAIIWMLIDLKAQRSF